VFVAVKYIASLGKIYRKKVKKISVRNLHREAASSYDLNFLVWGEGGTKKTLTLVLNSVIV
jgi:hypothetical protein